MNKFIIFEGCDRIGKSTQTDLTIRSHPSYTFHKLHYSTLPFKDNPELNLKYSKRLYESMFSFIESLKNTNHSFLFDRSHLGETVYGSLYRKLDTDWVFDLEKKYSESLKDHLYLIVFVGKASNIISRNDGLSYYDNITSLQTEINKFRDSFQKSSIVKKLLIDVDNKTPQEINLEILNFIK